MNEEKFRATLLKKIDLNNRLQALNLVKDKPTLKDKIDALLVLGIGPTEMAEILGTTSGYVKTAKKRIKKDQKKEKTTETIVGEKAE